MSTLIHIDPNDSANTDFEKIKEAWGISQNTAAFRRMVSVVVEIVKGPGKKETLKEPSEKGG